MTQAERTELAAPQGAPVALGAGGPTDNAALDPAAAKALLCERISTVLGVRICRFVKFAGKKPTYRLELEEKRVEFLSVRKLMSQRSVREEIAASTGKIIRKFKGKDWEIWRIHSWPTRAVLLNPAGLLIEPSTVKRQSFGLS
jgi:hypothetical protein